MEVDEFISECVGVGGGGMGAMRGSAVHGHTAAMLISEVTPVYVVQCGSGMGMACAAL